LGEALVLKAQSTVNYEYITLTMNKNAGYFKIAKKNELYNPGLGMAVLYISATNKIKGTAG
jgi:hypothetical protein